MIRWARCIELASTMTDDEKVRTGHATMRCASFQWTQSSTFGAVAKLSILTVDGELQMGAVSGLSDVESLVASNWLKENMNQFNPDNRRLAIEALGRNDDRLAALLELIEAGTIKRDEVSMGTMEKLKQTKNPSLKTKAESVLK